MPAEAATAITAAGGHEARRLLRCNWFFICTRLLSNEPPGGSRFAWASRGSGGGTPVRTVATPCLSLSLCGRQQETARKNDRSSELLFSSKISTLTVLVSVRLV